MNKQLPFFTMNFFYDSRKFLSNYYYYYSGSNGIRAVDSSVTDALDDYLIDLFLYDFFKYELVDLVEEYLV